MTPDTLLIIVVAALGVAAPPFVVWLRALKRIRHLEMTLHVQTTDADQYDALRGLLRKIAAHTDHLADRQAQLARRLSDRLDSLPPSRAEPGHPIAPHQGIGPHGRPSHPNLGGRSRSPPRSPAM